MSAKDCCCFLHSILNKWRKRKMWENRHQRHQRDIWMGRMVGELFIHVYIEKIIKVTIKFGKLKQVSAVGLVPKQFVVISVDTILKAQPDHLEDKQFAIRIIEFQSGRAVNTHLTVRAGPRRRWNNSSPCVSDRGRPIIAIWYLRSVSAYLEPRHSYGQQQQALSGICATTGHETSSSVEASVELKCSVATTSRHTYVHTYPTATVIVNTEYRARVSYMK